MSVFTELPMHLRPVLLLLVAACILAGAERQGGAAVMGREDGSYVVDGVVYRDLESLRKARPDLVQRMGLDAAAKNSIRSREPEDVAPTRPGPADAVRRAAAQRAVALLIDRAKAGAITHPTRRDGEVVAWSLTGLALLAAHKDAVAGPCAVAISVCGERVTGMLGYGVRPEVAKLLPGQNIDQSTWSYGHALLFLSELHLRRPSSETARAVQAAADHLARIQTSDGGWCHSASHDPNPLGYTTFNAVGNIAIAGLGAARRAGASVDPKVFERAIRYLADSANDEGGIGYSPRPGQKGCGEAGRSGGTLLALLLAGQERTSLFPKVKNYVEKRISQFINGHSSPLMHLTTGALACRMLGTAAWERFWHCHGSAMVQRQAADGSFPAPDGRPSDGGDRSTASQALILLLPEGHLRLLSGVAAPATPAAPAGATPSAPPVAAERPLIPGTWTGRAPLQPPAGTTVQGSFVADIRLIVDAQGKVTGSVLGMAVTGVDQIRREAGGWSFRLSLASPGHERYFLRLQGRREADRFTGRALLDYHHGDVFSGDLALTRQ